MTEVIPMSLSEFNKWKNNKDNDEILALFEGYGADKEEMRFYLSDTWSKSDIELFFENYL